MQPIVHMRQLSVRKDCSLVQNVLLVFPALSRKIQPFSSTAKVCFDRCNRNCINKNNLRQSPLAAMRLAFKLLRHGTEQRILGPAQKRRRYFRKSSMVVVQIGQSPEQIRLFLIPPCSSMIKASRQIAPSQQPGALTGHEKPALRFFVGGYSNSVGRLS